MATHTVDIGATFVAAFVVTFAYPKAVKALLLHRQPLVQLACLFADPQVVF